jgi:uncharacterized membrane protein YqjE
MQPGQVEPGLGARLRSIAVLLGQAAHARAALFAAEIELLISTALRAFLTGLAAVAFATLAVLVAIVAILLAVPDSNRALTAAIAALVLALAAITLMAWSTNLGKVRPFSSSLDELRQDVDQLRGQAPGTDLAPGARAGATNKK